MIDVGKEHFPAYLGSLHGDVSGPCPSWFAALSGVAHSTRTLPCRHVRGARQAAGAGGARGAARGQQPVLHPGLHASAGVLRPGRRPAPPHLRWRLRRAHALPLGAPAGVLLLATKSPVLAVPHTACPQNMGASFVGMRNMPMSCKLVGMQ